MICKSPFGAPLISNGNLIASFSLIRQGPAMDLRIKLQDVNHAYDGNMRSDLWGKPKEFKLKNMGSRGVENHRSINRTYM